MARTTSKSTWTNVSIITASGSIIEGGAVSSGAFLYYERIIMQDRIDGRIALRTSWMDRTSAVDILEDLAYINKVDLDIQSKKNTWGNEFKIAVLAKDPVDLAKFMKDLEYNTVPCKSLLKY